MKGLVHSGCASVPGGDGATVAAYRPRVLDLFSGIGGFSLGLERAGFETVAFCEISPKCRHLLATHWPRVPQFNDVCALTAADITGPIDVICGGFPCQDISFAGKGAGLAGERSGLWSEYARLVRELRPTYVIVENVSALLGRGLGDVLGDLAALGYNAWWDCIPAAAVGAPHRRDRIWIVAYPGSIEHEGYGDALRREIASGLSRANRLADTECLRAIQSQGGVTDERGWLGDCGSEGCRQALADTVLVDGQGLVASLADQEERRGPVERPAGPRGNGLGQWLSEPDVGRVAHGVPARVDRLHGLGNAVVPQIPEIIGRAIVSARSSVEQRAAA